MNIKKSDDIEEQFDRLLTEHLTRMYRDDLGHPDYKWRIQRRRSEVEREKLLLKCQEIHSGMVKGLRVLNVGSGWGGYVQAALESGAETYGIDIDTEVVRIANLRLESHGLNPQCVVGKAEVMPFVTGSFDRINCFSVLEHVQNVEHTVAEIARVLKPGGIAYLHFPNHWYPYEGHYKMTWIPFMPKPVAGIYLRLLGRPVQFINHINYLSPGIFNVICSSLPVRLERLSNDFYSTKKLKSIALSNMENSTQNGESLMQKFELPVHYRVLRAFDARIHKHFIGPLYGLFNVTPTCNFALHKL